MNYKTNNHYELSSNEYLESGSLIPNNKILIIDDEPQVVDSIKNDLEMGNYEIFAAFNGKEGLEICKEVLPVLILLDLKMPKMGGIEFLERINISHSDAYSVIVFTGHGDEEDIKKCFKLGICVFLKKPYNIYELRGLVKYSVESKHLQKQIVGLAKFTSENPNPVLRVGNDGTIVYANNAAVPLLKFWDCKPEDSLPAHLHSVVLDVFDAGVRREVEVTYGNTIFSLTIVPILDEGYINIYALDITERKKAEELRKMFHESERALMNAEFEKEKALLSAKQIKETNKIKSEFMANMSHELRTPLNGIMGMAQIVLMSSLQKDDEESLKTILSLAESFLSMVNDLLNFSKIDAGKQNINKREFNLKDTLDVIAQQQALLARKKGIEFIFCVNTNVPDVVIGDPKMLREVLVNIVENAVKFTEKGKIILEVELESYDDDIVVIHVHVKDTGIGIQSDKLQNIFEWFTQVETSSTRMFDGLGLGLTLSKRLVLLMGGKIWVESEYGKGSDFHFTVKFNVGDDIKKK